MSQSVSRKLRRKKKIIIFFIPTFLQLSMLVGTIFSTLLDDYPQRVSVVNARSCRSEACLLMIYGGIKMVFYPIQYDHGDDFGDCGKDTDSSPIIANL